MARPREFNENKALDRAMEVFWKRGYRNTPLDDLLEAMGIQRGSFYNTFGSKKETYLRTLRRYREVMAESGPYSAVAHLEPGMETLRALLDNYVNSLTDETGPRGCFFVHVSKEHRGDDPAIRDMIVPAIDQMRGIIQQSVEAAQEKGDLPADIDPRATALLFMSIAWGMHVLAEAGVPKEDLVAASHQLFTLTHAGA